MSPAQGSLENFPVRISRYTAPALIALLFLTAAGEGGCRRPARTAAAPAPAPDVLLITIDTLRADALGFAGNARTQTKNLDRLAAEGLVFTEAHAHNVMTLPSHANILTGLYPYAHGIRDNEGFRLDPKIPTLATLLAGKGYATAAFIGAFPLDARFGLSQGFDLYDQKYPQGAHEYDFSVAERPASEVVAAARAWYAGVTGRSRFLWVHLYDCHSPHVPPAALAAQYAGEPYLGEVAGVDEALGPLLSDVRASGRPTLVVVTSDHGEALGDHGEETHGLFAYEATLHIPLILWGAGVPAGARRTFARHVDILPTVLEACAAASPPGLPGRSLLGKDGGQGTSYFEALSASMTRGWAPLTGMIGDGIKFIDLPLPELYDLAADPGEVRNLVAERLDRVRALKAAMPATGAPAAPGPESADTVARLRSLGYLSGSAPPKARYGPQDDPKNLVGLDRDLQRVVGLYQRQKLEEAIALARDVIRRRPGMPTGYEYLSFLQGQLGKDTQAAATLEEASRRGLLSETLASRLGLLYSAQGKSREALGVLEPLRGSRNPDVLNALGIARATAGRVPEALQAFQSALSVDPGNAIAYQNIGLTYVQHDRPADAVAAFQKAFAINDRLPRAWNGLGAALERLGRHAEALDCWKRAIALDPEQFDAMLNLGVVALEQGNTALGRESLTRFVAAAPAGLFASDIGRARRLLAAKGTR
jgi:arylsulfatase A-like enzyme/tetratricopeptide (TPR) repeat protein